MSYRSNLLTSVRRPVVGGEQTGRVEVQLWMGGSRVVGRRGLAEQIAVAVNAHRAMRMVFTREIAARMVGGRHTAHPTNAAHWADGR